MSNDLITYSPNNVLTCITDIVTGAYSPKLPDVNGPHELNDINKCAYALLHEKTRYLTPREIGFLGNMTKANSLTKKQKKWLTDLMKKHLGVSITDEEEGVNAPSNYVATVATLKKCLASA
jgi:hypothetical protein